MPDKPFFVYYAPGATHAPASRADGVVGQVQGPVRRRLGRASRADAGAAEGAGRGPGRRGADASARTRFPAWDDMPDDLKPVLARQMEVYAGFLEHTDHHVGRLIDALDELGILEDTLVYYIIGDNGASAEGTPNGCFNELVVLNGAVGLETTEFMVSKIDEFGTPTAYNHYAVGWAHAMDTPYQWTKQIASHWGGTRNGTIVHWPGGIKATGRGPRAVPSRDRRRRHGARRRAAPRAAERQRRPAAAAARRLDGVHLRRRGCRRPAHDAVLRDVLQPRHLPRGLDRGDAAQHPVGRCRDARLRRRRLGAVRARRLDAGPRPRRPSSPTGCATSSGCS